MADVVPFPARPLITTPGEWARRRVASGDLKGPGIWVDQEAVERIERALAELYDLGLKAGELPKQAQDAVARLGGISPTVVSDAAFDALVWLTMAVEINRLVLNNPGPPPPS